MATLKPPKKVSNIVRLALFWAIIGMAIAIVFALNYSSSELKDVPISEVISRTNSGEIIRIEGSGNELLLTTKDSDKPTEKSYIQGGVSALLKEGAIDKESGAEIVDQPPSQVSSTIWNLGADIFVFLRMLQKVYDFLEVLLCTVVTRNVRKSDFFFIDTV